VTGAVGSMADPEELATGVMRLYHVPGSRSTRVLWMLEEIGAPYELTVMTREARKTAERISRHPLGRVPVVEFDDGRPLFESAAICIQLADLHPEVGLIPPVGSLDHGLVYQWSFFAMTELEPPIFQWMRARLAPNSPTSPHGSVLMSSGHAPAPPTSAPLAEPAVDDYPRHTCAKDEQRQAQKNFLDYQGVSKSG
jgi:glutathione S-transferase